MILGVGRDLLIPAALTVLAVLVWRRDLMGSLQLDSPWPLYVTTAIIVTTFFAALPGAVLGGVQAFGWAAIIATVGACSGWWWAYCWFLPGWGRLAR